MNIRKATAADIDLITELRLEFLRERSPDLDQAAIKALAGRSRDFFVRRLPIGDMVAMIGDVDGEAVSTAFMVVSEKPANPDFPDGRGGAIINVYTRPAHRRRGHSTAVVSALVEEARRLRIASLDLLASGEAASLYERIGFSPSGYSAMRLSLSGSEA
ncbi:MAG: GNAT family N-acetyltransferase [Planctomycetota bacterium]|nr:GNAT family N-acetyltransferase [Planctomycetota bacterium]